MNVAVTKKFNVPPEILFAVLTDIPHHTDWVRGPIELVTLSNGPAQLGTTWEQNTRRLDKTLVTVNTCNIYEVNRKFGWISEKPYTAQVIFFLEPADNCTWLTWIVELEEAGIVQLVEPLLVRETKAMIETSLLGLENFCRGRQV